MAAVPRLSRLLPVALIACRSPPADLAGRWTGDLDCEEAELVYATSVTMNLEAPAAGRHAGTLALQTTWTATDGVDYRQSTVWTVAVSQEFPRGAQDVSFVQADCAEALRMGDDEPVAEGCEAVGGGIGASSLAWDGADSLVWSGACVGALTRSGAVSEDSAIPEDSMVSDDTMISGDSGAP